MTIDFHAHLAPEDSAAPPFMRHLFDVDGYLERQTEAGIELTVLSYALTDLEGTAEEVEEAKRQHAFLAELIGREPDRFAALASVDPFGGDAWLNEAGRALDGGFKGLCFPTSRLGRYLDGEAAREALAFANERGVVVFLHPSDPPIDAEHAGDPIVRDWIGRPYDTGLCLARLLLSDTLGAFPNVRVVAAHSGGALPMLLGRLDSIHDTFSRRAALMAGGGPPGSGPPSGGPPGGGPPGGGPPGGGGPFFGPPLPEDARLQVVVGDTKPSERIGPLYFDTASYHPTAVRAAIDAVGVDRVVVGTDFPPAGRSPKPAVDLVRELPLTPEDRDKILAGNARQLLDAQQPASAVAT